MQKKENKVENWNNAYKDHTTTYEESLFTVDSFVNNGVYKFISEDIKNYLRSTDNPRILEVGCGGARLSLFLALRGFNVTCADNSPEAIRLARANFAAHNAQGTFVIDNLLESKLPAASFDCIISGGLLEHFENIHPVAHSITRLLKPTGIQIHCVIPRKFSTDSIMNFVKYPVRLIRNILRGDFKDIFSRSFRDFPHYENSFSAEEYCRVFREEGNQILKCEAGGLLYPFLAQLPFGLGNFLTKRFSGVVSYLIQKTDRRESGIMRFLSPTFFIYCRKRIESD